MKGFTIYEEYHELVSLLSEKEQGEMWVAIMKFMFDDIEPVLSDKENKIFKNLKRPLDKSKNKSKNKSNKNQNEIKIKSNQNQNSNKNKTHQDVNVIVSNYDNNYVVNGNVNNNLFDYIQENLGIILYPADIELIKTWEDNDLTRYAIKQASLNRAFSTKYVDAILRAYKSKGIKTVADAENDDRRHEKLKQNNNKKIIEQPNWLDKNTTDEELSVEEEKEFKKILEDFK